MNYQEAVNYLEDLCQFGIHLGLERIGKLVEKLDHPHKRFKSIHIAGTNGKGSVVAILSSILKEAGYKVGTYTSPHLLSYTERLQINGEQISEERFAQYVDKIEAVWEEGGTEFEFLTAMAFQYFADEKVDIAVVEVGLGGRLDATNVIIPLVSVITNVDYEHTDVLGKALGKIAGEKAGIIKENVPLVTAEEKTEAIEVIKKVCAERKASLHLPISFTPSGERSRTIEGDFPLKGEHQKTNLSVALKVTELLGDRDIRISGDQVREGLRKVRLPGRLEVARENPLIIVDGAHNPAGAKVLREYIEKKYGKVNLILGILSSKDIKGIVDNLAPVAESVIVTKSSHPRTSGIEEVARQLRANDISVLAVKSVREAMKLVVSRRSAKPTVVTGSLFTVADALSYLKGSN